MTDSRHTEEQPVVIIGAGPAGISAAIQLAKAQGAIVTAVVSPGKIDFVKRLGADHVIDYTTGDPAAGIRSLAPDGVDIVVDVDIIRNVELYDLSLQSLIYSGYGKVFNSVALNGGH